MEENKKCFADGYYPTANTAATVYVPSKNETGVTESGKPVVNNRAVIFIRYENGYSVYEVGSGNYLFRALM